MLCHSFIWIINAPKPYKDNREACIRFANDMIHAFLTDEGAQPEFYDLVKTEDTKVYCKKRCSANEETMSIYWKFLLST